MNNSEKMLVCLDQQDLDKADKYFKRALVQDDSETLLSLAAYLEGIGFSHRLDKSMSRSKKNFRSTDQSCPNSI